MKVANIIEEGRLGGPQIRMTEVATHLQQRNIITTIILPKSNSERFQERLNKVQVPYKSLTLHRLTKDKKHLLLFVVLFFPELWAVTRYLKSEHFDLVDISGGSWQLKSAIAGKLAGCKVIWHLNDTQMPRIIKSIFRLVAKICTDGFITAGRRVGNYYLDMFEQDDKTVFEMQAPVDCSVFNPDIVQPASKIETSDSLNVVTVANVNPIKGLEYFIKMAGLVNKYHKDQPINFWIIGSIFESQIKYYQELQSLIAKCDVKNIHFFGQCDDVKSVLKATDIYVCSSLAEASPISVWEAMSMEKAIVSADVGDVSRFIANGENGYIVPVANATELADGVGKLISDSERRERFGKRSREIALKYLDILNCVDVHEEAYQSIVQK
jgi:glycosyltransferase involved in cell wall biosynthesis